MALKIIALLVAFIGWAGTVVPFIPGTVLIFLAGVGYWALSGFAGIQPASLMILAVLALIAETSEHILSASNARRFGATRVGMIGAVAGGIFGIFIFSLPGVIIGPILGAIVGEVLSGRKFKEAFHAGVGAGFGTIGSMVLRFLLGGVMVWLLWRAVL